MGRSKEPTITTTRFDVADATALTVTIALTNAVHIYSFFLPALQAMDTFSSTFAQSVSLLT